MGYAYGETCQDLPCPLSEIAFCDENRDARTRWLLPEEEVRLRAAIEARHPEHMPELDFALNTGLRLSEMYDLT